MDKCRSCSVMEATMLVVISVIKVLGLPHCGSWWIDFRLLLNSICHFLMLELLWHLSPKALFSNTIISLDVFSSQIENSMQMCCLVFKFIFLELEQHTFMYALFLYQREKTKIFIMRCLFWCGTMQKTFLFLRILLLYMYLFTSVPLPPSENTDS